MLLHHQTFELRFSFYSLLFVLLVYSGAVISIIFLPWLWWVKTILLSIILSSLILFLRQHVYRTAPHAIVKLLPTADNLWQLTNIAQHSLTATLQGSSICSLYLVLLNFKVIDSDKKISVIILPDALSNQNFRQLRLAIKGLKMKS